MLNISQHIKEDWDILGGFLGLSSKEVDELEDKYSQKPVRAAWKMLVTWRDRCKELRDIKIQLLRQALQEINRPELCDLLE